ncbi:MAG TPA: hypothetical protein VMT15_05670 [Bryobacteraceae bacterium]|nr:hypothetical protein [Bryobacteraceae bacterium]
MKRRNMTVLLASLVFTGASHVLAQEPSAYLRIIREDIKEGKSAAHQKTEMAFARAFAKTKIPNYTAWDAMSGPSQVWFVDRYDDYAGIEAESKIASEEPLSTALSMLDEADGALRTASRTMIARYQKDLSYTAVPAEIAKYRYINVTTYRIRPGREADFTEMRKILSDAWEKAGYKGRRAVYLVVSGAPGGTYFVLRGMESLKALDSGTGLPAGTLGDRYTKLLQETVISSEVTTFAVNPKMSYPPKEYITANPDFWAPKPKPAAAK